MAEEPPDAPILEEQSRLLVGSDHERHFFEVAWMHKDKGRCHLSYSTGNTHYLAYETGDTPSGPLTYQGPVLDPVQGWTTHHSVIQVGER